MAGTQEEGFNFNQTTFTGSGFLGLRSPFIPADPTKVVTGIAIGQNSYARSGSVMVGTHNYKGDIADTNVDTSSEASMRSHEVSVNATTVGVNSFNNSAFGVVNGAYSAITGAYDGGGFRSNASQNFGATITGSLNSIESKTASSNYSGVGNNIVGVANREFNANGALIFGAGNEITNSVTTVSAPTSSGNSPKALQQTLMGIIKDAEGGGSTMAIGGGNKADYTQKTQITGVNNTVKGTAGNIAKLNYVSGFKNTVTNASNTIVMGNDHAVTANNTIAIGGLSAADTRSVANTTSIGYDAKVSIEGGVALGYQSNAAVDKGAVGYDLSVNGASSETNATWKATAAAVSVGNVDSGITRQITSVAAGTEDTDAVNVAQLKKAGVTVKKKDGSLITVDKTTGDNGTVYTVGVDTSTLATKTDVAGAKTHYYSVNDFGNATMQSLGNYNNDGAKGIASMAAGIGSSVKVGASTFQGATASVFGALNTVDASTGGPYDGVANSIVGVANTTKNANGALIFGAGNLIKNSYANVTLDTSALNPSDPESLTKSLAAAVKDSGGDVLAIGGANEVDYGQFSQVTGISNKLTGKEGTTSKFNSITGSKNTASNVQHVTVMGTENEVKDTEGAIVFGDKRTMSSADGSIIMGSSANGTTTSVKNAVAIGSETNVTTEGGVAIGADSIASTDKGVAGYDLSTGTSSTDTSSTWKSTAAAVSVGDVENGITRQITSVAAGTADTDAVNVAQLKKAVTNAADGNDTLKADTNALSLSGKTLSVSVKDTAGNEVKGSVDLSDISDVVDTNTTYTMSSTENDDNTTTINLKDSDGKENKVTVATKDTRNTVKAGENVTLNTKDNADGSYEYTVNVKADGKVAEGNTGLVSGDTIYKETHVSTDGSYVKTGSTVGENLSALDKQVSSNTQALNNLGSSVNKLDDRIDRVGAGAAALAALHPLDFDPDDKWDIAAGYGNYKDADAVAVGAFYRPNEDTMLSVGGSFGGGENMVNAGVSMKLGQGNHVSTSRVAMAKEIKALTEKVSVLESALAKINPSSLPDGGKNVLFPDVSENHWAYEYVTKLSEAGLIEGYPDGTFKGDRMMTRYEFAALVYRLMQSGKVGQNPDMDRLVGEFTPELQYIRIDTVSKHKDGTPDIQRVRVVKEENK